MKSHLSRFHLRLLTLISLFVGVLTARAQGTFVNTGAFKTGQQYCGWTVLQDGRVFFAGGWGNTRAAEIYDPATGTFSLTGSMNAGRVYPAVTTLSDGRVLVVGGTGGTDPTSNYVTSMEVWDPATGVFSLLSEPSFLHVGGNMFQLPNGHILISAWEHYLTVCDLVHQTSKSISELYQGGTLLPLKDGRYLIVGEFDNYLTAMTTLEIFDPTTETIVWRGNLNHGRSRFAAVVLHDGRVLISGGDDSVNNPVYGNTYSSSELFDPQTKSIKMYSMLTARSGHWAAELPDGRVLISGPYYQSYSKGSEVLDFTNGTSTSAPSPILPRTDASAIPLSDSRVLLASGTQGPTWISQCELFMPSGWSTTPPPVANAGANQIVYAGSATTASATLDGTSSTGNIASYTWSGAFGTATGASPTVTLSTGISTVLLTVTDIYNRTSQSTVEIAVVPGSSDSTLQQQVQALTGQVNQLQSDNASLQSQLNQAHAANQTLQSQNTALQSQLADAQATITNLQGQVSTLSATNQSLQTQLTAANNQISTLQSDLAAANAQIATLTTQNSQLTAANQSLQTQLAQANAQIAQLTSALQAAQAANQTLQVQNASLQSQLDAANSEVAALTAEVTQLTSANQTLTAQNYAMIAQVTALNQFFATLFNNPTFQLPGSTPQQQLQNLVSAIQQLNRGQQQALYKNLGG